MLEIKFVLLHHLKRHTMHTSGHRSDASSRSYAGLSNALSQTPNVADEDSGNPTSCHT